MPRSDEARAKGRTLGVKILQTIKSSQPKSEPAPPAEAVDLAPIIEAVNALKESKQDIIIEAADLDPIVRAIRAVKLSTNVDLSAVEKELNALAKKDNIDLKPVIDELQGISNAVDKLGKSLDEIIEISKKEKVIKYDNNGRIISIGVKNGD